VVVAIRAAVPGREAMLAATAENAGRCGEWYAWHDRMPGKRPTLHVIGSCTFTTGGYEVELRRPDSEGFNPVIRILEKHVRPPTGQAVDVISVVPVHYTEETEAPYTHVQITPDNVLVPVREVF
jgi:hypothetical protein